MYGALYRSFYNIILRWNQFNVTTCQRMYNIVGWLETTEQVKRKKKWVTHYEIFFNQFYKFAFNVRTIISTKCRTSSILFGRPLTFVQNVIKQQNIHANIHTCIILTFYIMVGIHWNCRQEIKFKYICYNITC